MARYEITAPDGNSYEITAPDTASENEVMEYAKSNYQKPEPSIPTAEEPGFVSRVATDIGKRASGVATAITEPIQSMTQPEKDAGYLEAIPQRLLRVGGQAVATVGDIAGEAAKSLYRTVTPEPVQKGLASAGKSILDTEAGQMGLQALQAGGEAYGRFRKAYPELAKDVEAAANIAMYAPTALAAKRFAGDVIRTGVKTLPKSIEERLYGSATKMPLSKKWVKTADPKDMSIRQKAIREGIRSEVLPTEAGLNQVATLEKQARQSVDDVISNLTAQGKTIKRADLLTGLDDAYTVAESSSNPDLAKSVINGLKEQFMKRPEEMSPEIVQAIKRQLYKESSWTGVTPTGVGAQFTAKGRKGIANAAMNALEELEPALKGLNQTDAARIALKEGIERAVGRIGNRNLSDLGSEIMAGAGAAVGGGPGAAVGFTLKKLIEMPELKSKMAFAINRARKVGYRSEAKQIGKAAGMAIGGKAIEVLSDDELMAIARGK